MVGLVTRYYSLFYGQELKLCSSMSKTCTPFTLLYTLRVMYDSLLGVYTVIYKGWYVPAKFPEKSVWIGFSIAMTGVTGLLTQKSWSKYSRWWKTVHVVFKYLVPQFPSWPLAVSFKDDVTVILLLSVSVHVYITDMLGNEYSFKKLSQTF